MTSSSSSEGDLEVALELADFADSISMRLFAGSREFTLKGGGSPVSEADVQIESGIRELLRRSHPRDQVYGEEFGGDRDGRRVWLIDPIDGTASFIEGGANWGTLIALVEDGRPVVGAVSRPVAASRWWGATGLGAFRNGQQIQVSATSDIGQSVMQEDFRLSTARRVRDNPVAAIGLECAAISPWLDQFFYMAIAEGSADFTVNWWAGSGPDLASQVAVVEAAGGRFSDLAGEADFNASVIVVSNGLLHESVLQRLNEIAADRGIDPDVEPTEDIPAIWRAREQQPAAAWRVPK